VRDYPALLIAWPSAPDTGAVDLMLAALDDTGPLGLEETATGIRVFFRDAAARDAAAGLAAAASPMVICTSLNVPDEDWAARSQAALTPIRVGQMVVAPPWAATPPEDGHLLIINPAMGFGTGHHASTRLCLDLMQRLPLAGADVIDVGTGSGVLAIAAWRLGAARVTAIDHDADAVASAHENVALNGAGDAITVIQGDLMAHRGASAHLVTANLTGAVLCREAQAVARLARPGGAIVLSGILTEEAGQVVAAFAQTGWPVEATVTEDEWTGLLLRGATSPSASTAH